MKSKQKLSETFTFLPHIGCCYGRSPFGLKLLILGESHHVAECDQHDDLSRITANTVHHPVFWKKLEGLLIPHMRKSSLTPIWDSIIFYNYVQHIVGEKSRIRPTAEMWISSETVRGFKEVLNRYKPDRILVVGKTNWRWMAGKDQFLNHPPITESKFKLPTNFTSNISSEGGDTCAYWYPTGASTYALAAPIYHPGYPKGFHYLNTTAIVKKLLVSSWKCPTPK